MAALVRPTSSAAREIGKRGECRHAQIRPPMPRERTDSNTPSERV